MLSDSLQLVKLKPRGAISKVHLNMDYKDY